ncbi:hypothetical protein [Brevundimonas sp.]|uniref:hypothetical protein n=1 Tax=Brevundimonas sp. TaxID=1871086 RepID=UPI0035B0D21E
MSRTRDILDHVRHARHPYRGWRKWGLIGIQTLIGLVVLFALINLGLTLWVQTPGGIPERARAEVQGLWFSALDGRETDPDAFAAIYGGELGQTPSEADIRAYFQDRAEQRTFLLDQVMVEHLDARFGGLDGGNFPAGVYVGMRALGPDGAPAVYATKWMAQFLFFPRHAYILVVPESGEPISFSASMNGKFDDEAEHPDFLEARIAPFDARAYDYPSSGQAIHEMTRITDDPAEIPAALERLRAAERRLAESDIHYGVLAPNSNTVVGCILEESGVISRRERQDTILTLRAPGVGAACG